MRRGDMKSGPYQTCEQLAAAAQSGDNTALEQLAERWWSRMRQWAFAEFGNRPLMEDVAQDSLVKLFERIDRYDSGRPFAPWLRVLVRNCARDTLRKRREGGKMVELSEHRDPGKRIDMQTGASLAITAFSSLTRRQRQVMQLCDRQGLTPKEAAAELGITASTTRVILHDARKRLRLQMLKNHAEVFELVRETA